MDSATRQARRWRLSGRVQGVGFRPFVYRLAHEFGLRGQVSNASGTVCIEAEGEPTQLAAFELALLQRAPPLARPRIEASEALSPAGWSEFRIASSQADAAVDIHVPPDQFACDDCLAELRDPQARRYRYPFINCTQCGPRYTLIRAMPYDRPNTTMADFPLCPDCAAEYADPLDRRFHAQPLACARCGPRLWWHQDGRDIHGNEPALAACADALRAGQIVAVRGIGGYHLICAAANADAVARLRARKGRPSKPLAVMPPLRGADGLEVARELGKLTPAMAAALCDPLRPIVLAPLRAQANLAPGIAPGLNQVGLMLPYAPLHALLLEDFGAPLVATSGNLSGEPVLTEPAEAQQRLAPIVDAFLHHDRPIQRPADDPVMAEFAGAIRPIRLGRGNAPLELELPATLPRPVLALGAFLKTTVALGWDRRAVVSPHIGDLHSPRSRAVLEQVAADLQHLYGHAAAVVACDAHPDFPTHRWAQASGLPVVPVYHHHAHAAAVAGEFGCVDPLLCLTWDGVGLGPDGSLWGGEALYGLPGNWRRLASWRPLRPVGGERAALEPWRSALAGCWDAGIAWPAAADRDTALLRAAHERGLGSPATTAMGRLFDAAAALVTGTQTVSYEGEAPLLLETLAADSQGPACELPLERDPEGVWRSDWRPLLPRLLDAGRGPAERAALFHASVCQAAIDQVRQIAREQPLRQIGLSGGVFQNRRLSAALKAALEREGYQVLIPVQLPVNDAAISFGQLIEARARLDSQA